MNSPSKSFPSFSNGYENIVLVRESGIPATKILPSKSLTNPMQQYTKLSNPPVAQLGMFPVDPVQDFDAHPSDRPQALITYPRNNTTKFSKKSHQNPEFFEWHNSSTPSTSTTSSGWITTSTDSSNSNFLKDPSPLNHKLTRRSTKKLSKPWKKTNRWDLLIILIVSLMCLTLILAALILILWLSSLGWPPLTTLHKFTFNNQKEHSITTEKSPYDHLLKQDLKEQLWNSQEMMKLFDSENIRNNLRWIASHFHVAGSLEQLELMNKLEQEYKKLDFDVKSYEYEVLLSYPDYQHPNTLEFFDSSNNNWKEISNGLAEALGPPEALEQQTDRRNHVWWNAYSANGTVEAELVYANYGTFDDYEKLKKV